MTAAAGSWRLRGRQSPPPSPPPPHTCESSGRMVMPAWPPMTGTLTSFGSTPAASATNASARTTSSVVTPNSLEGS